MPRLIQLCAAWLALLSFALSTDGIGTFAVAALAGIDGEHEVSVVDGEGGRQVRLHHGHPGQATLHRHTWTTRLATGLPAARSGTESDHVLDFARLADFPGKEERSPGTPAACALPARSESPTGSIRPLFRATMPPRGLALHLGRGTRHLLI